MSWAALLLTMVQLSTRFSLSRLTNKPWVRLWPTSSLAYTTPVTRVRPRLPQPLKKTRKDQFRAHYAHPTWQKSIWSCFHVVQITPASPSPNCHVSVITGTRQSFQNPVTFFNLKKKKFLLKKKFSLLAKIREQIKSQSGAGCCDS